MHRPPAVACVCGVRFFSLAAIELYLLLVLLLLSPLGWFFKTGIAQMPKVNSSVKAIFPAGTPFGLGLFPDEAVAIGATTQAFLLQVRHSSVRDLTRCPGANWGLFLCVRHVVCAKLSHVPMMKRVHASRIPFLCDALKAVLSGDSAGVSTGRLVCLVYQVVVFAGHKPGKPRDEIFWK